MMRSHEVAPTSMIPQVNTWRERISLNRPVTKLPRNKCKCPVQCPPTTFHFRKTSQNKTSAESLNLYNHQFISSSCKVLAINITSEQLVAECG
ncbi:hypothetical protein AVEN_28579-1 [Araneus ventricosus]|uniref:Uncharacterized protein n=1 Tax=Araneus ventricosus TaxID=182803 RepID=A0A4Y2DF32_ARAVE|nr:hypothetical protein AVEN_28579-1 [Araneus ventricosus]